MYNNKYNAGELAESVKLYGTLLDKNTDGPVSGALILSGEQATISDAEGNYLFYYFLSGDEDRNLPVRLLASAQNYLTYDTSIVLYPETRLNLKMQYAAPIIMQIVLYQNQFCQAAIFDYQGAGDVRNVYAHFYYMRTGERTPSLKIEVPLNPVVYNHPQIAHFQVEVSDEIAGYGILMNSFHVFAYDKMNYGDSTSSAASGVDTLLFSPEPPKD